MDDVRPATDDGATIDPLVALGDVFRGVSPDLLTSLRARARVRHIDDGTILCHQGHVEDVIYILLDGQANVWVHDVGEPVLVAYLSAGEPIGEIELLMNSARAAQVVASGPVTLLELSHADLDVAQRPELFRALTRTVIERLLTVQRQRVYDVAESLRQQRAPGGLFVSYAHEDELFTKRLVADLKHHQVSVWLDQFDIHPGKSWPRQIGEALDGCEAMLVVMSPASMESGNTEDEWNYYLDHERPIIPVLQRACAVPFRLNKLEAVVFEGVDYDEALSRLVDRTRQHLEGNSGSPRARSRRSG